MTHSDASHAGTPLQRTCPNCGAVFTCWNSPSCWCAGRTLPESVKSWLADRYATCVCPACLDRLIAEDAAGMQNEQDG
ncbi:MAG: hypothetical protein A3K90_09185 [Pelodictyon luteolum]|uniref:Cysteine-rich CWC n=1 Tax=Pelodictyon luteolum TaxID=1100 RepID=A0A165LZF1_PELLU|nr:cysteine-rich CWC family protein [Pelodictyon luteolum]KZK74618.1 MAG: hypothetical protein A3K90_09185 [Pelodictyon luteolum]